MSSRAATATDPYQEAWNFAVGDDLSVAADPNQPAGSRLLHAGLAASILVPGVDLEALGLKAAGKTILKGGIEQVTLHAAGKEAAAGGKLVLQGGVKLSRSEGDVAAMYAKRGHEVIAKPATGVGRTADFTIDGQRAELKTVSNAREQTATQALRSAIKEATGQAKNVIIDARNQRGLIEAKARSTVENIVGQLPRSRISNVDFLGRDGKRYYEFTVTKK